MDQSQKFRKAERLCSKKDIQSLFDHGNSFGLFPFRVVWQNNLLKEAYPARIVISVPKKRFKRAVERNLIKRRIKESYRKRKTFLYEHLNALDRKINFILIYTGESVMEFKDIDHKISLVIDRFSREIKSK